MDITLNDPADESVEMTEQEIQEYIDGQSQMSEDRYRDDN